jgi:single-stranded-DNA-specific exonuclease
MEKKWLAKPLPSREITERLCIDLQIGEPLAVLLAQRGIESFEQARHFFRPQPEFMHDPFLMKDMDKAVERLKKAIDNREKILIYGDYDVDGTTSVALVYLFLQKIHPFTEYYIPDRFREGYGISAAGISHAEKNNFSLIISLDCGIRSAELVKQAKDKGIDFIICDHHQPGETLPPATAVLDPKRPDCGYPYKELSGCGVGFKLCQAYSGKYGLSPGNLLDMLDLVCVSIACDIVEVTGENRVLSFLGLRKLNSNPRPGLGVLLEKAFEKYPKSSYDISDIVFYLGPRINAAGRMEHGSGAVDLLIEPQEEKARVFADRLHITNNSRKEAEQQVTREAEDILSAAPGFEQRRSTVVYSPEWNKGVIGIVAARLVEKFYRPTVVLTLTDGKVTGSARSVSGFDIHAAIEECSSLLMQFGGHTHAAGLTMREDQVDAFSAAFEEAVKRNIRPESLYPVLEYDLELDIRSITPVFVKKMLQLAPFGPGNMNPVFLSRRVQDTGMVKSYGEHLSMNFFVPGGVLGAMAFFQERHLNAVKQGKVFDICYHIEISGFNGKEKPQLRILDMKPSDT